MKTQDSDAGNLQLPAPLLLVLLKIPMFLQPGNSSCLHVFQLLVDRVMTTEMVLDSWSRPQGSQVTVPCSVNMCLLLPLPRVDRCHASLENKTNLASSFLNLQWPKGPTSSFLAWLKWTQHSSMLHKFSSPAISAPLSLLPAGSDPKGKC